MSAKRPIDRSTSAEDHIDWRHGGFEPESWIGLRSGKGIDHRMIGRPVHPPLVVRLARRLAQLLER
jgi:hypothetical protein